MVFHIAVCGPDAAVRTGLERWCMDYFSRRADACIVEQLADPAELLARDAAGVRYELYLLELTAAPAPEGLAAAAALRGRGRRAPLAFIARTPAHAYSAYRVDAMQYLLLPVRPEDLFALLDRAVEPEYGPALTVSAAEGLRVLPYAELEYLECTHHVVHFHLTTGEEVVSLSLRVPFSEVAQPLLADSRFVQPHRSYVVNLAAAQLLAPGELRMASGARIPIPRGREAAVRAAFRAWAEGKG
ncbi:MAG: LytR/AlgR family response regulator transcription factor [Faecalibacterium sp.]